MKPSHSDAYRKITGILRKLQRHPLASPFLEPVDLSCVPDYLDVVREPMDLSTVERKLAEGKYTSAYEFSADVRKIWSNAFQYNGQDTELYHITVTLSSYFESLFKGHENLLLTDRNDAIEGLYKQLEALKKEIKDIKGPKAPSRVPQLANDRPMTLQEKKVLGQNIRSLQPQHLRGLIAIIKDSLPKDIQGTELEFDIDTLSPKVCRELERYVKQCLSGGPGGTVGKTQGKKKSNGGVAGKQQDINEKLEDLASTTVQQKAESESESSSSSSSEEGDQGPGGALLGMEMDMFGAGGEYGSLWSYQHPKGPNDHNEPFMKDFDLA